MFKHWFLVLVSVVLGATNVWADEEPVFEVDGGSYRTPTRMLKPTEYPTFVDDHDLKGLRLAIDRQLKRFSQKKLTGTIQMGGKSYPLSKARESLEVFRALIEEFDRCQAREAKSRCYESLNTSIRAKFNVFAPSLNSKDPRFGKENFAFFTGYHTHRVEGRLVPDGEFKHAIYGHPRNPKYNEKTRVQIDFDNAFKGLGLELVYTKHLFDVYLMHVAGSGKVSLREPDGTSREFYLQWDGTNRQRWEFISLYMAKKGYISNGSIPSQRKFMREHPEKQREILSHCPSYIYLKPTNEPPKGSDSVAVTDGRTIATDTRYYPFKGLLTYIQAQRPVETGHYDFEEENRSRVPFQAFSRFFLDQDTGGAIEGKARADIYFGSDDYAYWAAMFQEEVGKIHYFLLK